MLIVIGRAEADPADLAAVRPALNAMMQATWAESGCISYSLTVEQDGTQGGPAVIAICERWADMESLMAHFRAPHMADFNRQIAGRLRGLDVRLYEVARELPFPSLS